jgi:acetyl esterase/lipase
LATHYDAGNSAATDPIERLKTRPDFSVFIYPVITMVASFTHGGSRSNLVGNNPSTALIDSLSNEKQITEDTPPTFLVHGTVDNVVPWRNSQEFADGCTAKQVANKFHKITDNCGGHGFGYNCENWGEGAYSWLKDEGYLDATTPVAIMRRSSTHSENRFSGPSISSMQGQWNVLGRNQNRNSIREDGRREQTRFILHALEEEE